MVLVKEKEELTWPLVIGVESQARMALMTLGRVIHAIRCIRPWQFGQASDYAVREGWPAAMIAALRGRFRFALFNSRLSTLNSRLTPHNLLN